MRSGHAAFPLDFFEINLLFTSSQGISLHKFAVIDILYLFCLRKFG